MHFFRHYTKILEALFFILKQEHEPRVVDNICAAVCRMISANVTLVPMEQVWNWIRLKLTRPTYFNSEITLGYFLGEASYIKTASPTSFIPTNRNYRLSTVSVTMVTSCLSKFLQRKSKRNQPFYAWNYVSVYLDNTLIWSWLWNLKGIQ